MSKKRLLVLFLLADAVLGPILLSGMCSTKDPLDPAKFGLSDGKSAAAAVATSRSTGDLSPASIDMCAFLDLGGEFAAAQAAYVNDIQLAAAGLPGSEDMPTTESACAP